MNEKEVKEKLTRFKKLLVKDIYTVKQLVHLGIYGSKSSVHRDIHRGLLKTAYTTERRLVIFTDSLLERIELAIKQGGNLGKTTNKKMEQEHQRN